MNKIAVKIFSLAEAVALMAGCISNNPAQKLDSFVDNAELKSDSYNAQFHETVRETGGRLQCSWEDLL